MELQSTNNSYCEQNEDNLSPEGNYYSHLMEHNPYRLAWATILIGIMIASLITNYGIIWMERYGSDKKRTIINQLVSSMCWVFITWNCTVQISKLVRFLYGPLGLKLCVWTFILQRSLTTRIMLLVNTISIIFWLKNPMAFHDDF
jgi:hypothetical protein